MKSIFVNPNNEAMAEIERLRKRVQTLEFGLKLVRNMTANQKIAKLCTQYLAHRED